jgi:hypothetical protein
MPESWNQCQEKTGNVLDLMKTNNISSAKPPWKSLYIPSLIYSCMQIGLELFAVYSSTYTMSSFMHMATNL